MPTDYKLCNYQTPRVKFLISHYRAVHLNDDNFNVKCDLEGCEQQYSKCSSHVLHIYRCHRSFLVCDDPVSSDPDPASSDPDLASSEDAGPSIVSQPIAVESTGDTIDPFVMDQFQGLDAEQQQKMSALFLLGLKGHCLSQAAVDDIISSCQDMFKHHNLRIRAGVQERLLNFGIDVLRSIPFCHQLRILLLDYTQHTCKRNFIVKSLAVLQALVFMYSATSIIWTTLSIG